MSSPCDDDRVPDTPPRAIFAGLCTLDVIHSVERVPAPNEKTVATELLMAAGGPATNAAVAFAHLGGGATLATRLPHHPLTDVIRADLTRCRVALDVHPGGDGPPVTASIMVTRATGERAVVSPTTSATASSHPSDPAPSLNGVEAVLIDGYHRDISLPLAHSARASGIPVIMDAGSLKPHTEEVARAADAVVASADLETPDGSRGPAAVLAWLTSLGVARTAITRGGESIVWRTPGASGEVTIPRVEVTDTLGAGDFFHGALTWRIASLGMDDARFAEDLAWAAAAVAPSLTTFGTRAWLSA